MENLRQNHLCTTEVCLTSGSRDWEVQECRNRRCFSLWRKVGGQLGVGRSKWQSCCITAHPHSDWSHLMRVKIIYSWGWKSLWPNHPLKDPAPVSMVTTEPTFHHVFWRERAIVGTEELEYRARTMRWKSALSFFPFVVSLLWPWDLWLWSSTSS